MSGAGSGDHRAQRNPYRGANAATLGEQVPAAITMRRKTTEIIGRSLWSLANATASVSYAAITLKAGRRIGIEILLCKEGRLWN